jgi:threonine/homoserine/homoserine lactone efflux protein
MLSTEFWITSLVVVLVPGTGVIYTVSTGLFLGWRASLAAAVGCTLGIVPHLTACILGLSAIVHMSAVAFQVIKYIGAAYLVYLAWSMWRETGGIRFQIQGPRMGPWQIIVKGFLINILNPKLSIFFLAFLPLFVTAEAYSPTLQMLALSAVFMGITLVIFMIYGICANSVRSNLTRSARRVRWLQRTFAVIFGLLGIKLALAEL